LQSGEALTSKAAVLPARELLLRKQDYGTEGASSKNPLVGPLGSNTLMQPKL
jgi:hypothetical protein